MKVLITGASGLVGRAALKHFTSLSGWDVVGVSRRPPGAEAVEGVTYVSADLSNTEQCAQVFGSMHDITHVVHSAIMDGTHSTATPREALDGNLALFTNLIEPLEQASKGLEHVSVMEGTAAYPISSLTDPIQPRLREDDPRGSHEVFYFLVEDYLDERAAARDWGWTIWRATWIFGETLAGTMNMIPVIGVYGAMLREQGEPLHFPGNPGWRVIREACDSDLLAEAFSWAATHPISRNQIYNVSNGDQFDILGMWPSIAAMIGMEAGENRPMALGEEIPRRADEWAAVVAKYKLKAPTDPLAMGGESFAFFDRLDGYHSESQLRLQLSSIIKLRQHGFANCIDTEEMFKKHFKALQDAQLLPTPK